MVVDVVECIYKPCIFSHSVSMSSSECSRCSPPSSLAEIVVCVHRLDMSAAASFSQDARRSVVVLLLSVRRDAVCCFCSVQSAAGTELVQHKVLFHVFTHKAAVLYTDNSSAYKRSE